MARGITAMIKRRLILLAIGLLGLFGLYKIYNTSFVSVTVEGSDSGSYSFSAIDKTGRVRKTLTLDGGYARLRLPRGRYQIVVQHDNKSYFTVVDSRPFMSTSSLTAKLTPEASRRFVGNNPLPCQHYFNKVLVSYSCGALDNGLKVHVPATSQVPTYTLPADLQVSGSIQGFVSTRQGSVGLINVPIGSDEGQAQNYYRLMLFNSHFKVIGQRQLFGLDSRRFYSIQPYGAGFLIYDSGFTSAFTFRDWQAPPKSLGLAGPQVRGVNALELETYKNDALSEYFVGNKTKAASELTYTSGSTTQRWKLPKTYQRALICEAQTICALTTDHHLDVYSLNQAKPKLLYQLGGINDMAVSSRGFLMVNSLGVINYQASQRNGYLAYSFGGYSFSDLQSEADSLLVTVKGPDGTAVLDIDQSQPVADSIDKQLLIVRANLSVNNISTYGNHIFITANSGPLVYQSASNSYIPDPVLRKAAVKAIQSSIDQAGINRDRYTIQIY